MNPTKTILECAATSSTSAKQAILVADGSELLKKCLNYGLDPYKVFGIKKYAFANPVKESPAWDAMFDCCDKLIQRIYTGDLARGWIFKVSGFLTEDQQKMFKWILDKDFKAGIAEGIVNKAFPKLIPEFEVQLAQPSKFLKKVVYPCLVQPKLDGVRTIALVDPKENSVTYYSRNGKLFSNFTCFDKELLKMSNKEPKMFDGEVVGPPEDQFRGIMQQCRRKYDVEPKGLNFYVFDWMPMHHFARQYATLDQQERTDFLLEFCTPEQESEKRRVTIVDGLKCNNEEELMQYYDICVSKGYEGVIIKNLNGEYDFKRSNVWIKMKPDETEDFKIIDVLEGRKGTKYEKLLGKFVIERNGVKVQVGSGIHDDQRMLIEEAHKFYVGKTIEVMYDSITPDGSLRFPRFKKIREDK